MRSDERQVGEESSSSSSSLGNEFTTATHLIVQVLDAEAFPQVSEDLGTVLLEFEMSWEIFPVEDMKMKVEEEEEEGGGDGPSSLCSYLLKRWLLTLILLLALKSSGSSMTGTGTWFRSLI